MKRLFGECVPWAAAESKRLWKADLKNLPGKEPNPSCLEFWKHAEDVCEVKLGLAARWREKKCIDFRGNNRFSVSLFHIGHRGQPEMIFHSVKYGWAPQPPSQFDMTILINYLPIHAHALGSDTSSAFFRVRFRPDCVFSSNFFYKNFEKLKLTHDSQRCRERRCVWADSDNSAISCRKWSCPVSVGETDGKKNPESAITDNLHCCLFRLLNVLVDV